MSEYVSNPREPTDASPFEPGSDVPGGRLWFGPVVRLAAACHCEGRELGHEAAKFVFLDGAENQASDAETVCHDCEWHVVCLTRDEERDGEAVLAGRPKVFQNVYGSHAWHFEAEDHEGGRGCIRARVSQIPDEILAVLKDFDGVLDAALLVVAPECEDVVGIVCGQKDRSVHRAHAGSN